MIQIFRSLKNCLRLLVGSRKIKSVYNYLPGNIILRGKNIIVQESKIVGVVDLGSNVKINNSFLSGNIAIDRFTSINGPNTSIISSGSGKIEIGTFCSIARGVQIQEFNHNFSRATSYYVFQNIFKRPREYDITTKGDVVIEDDVWIGANCIILSGVRIGRGAIVAAGSVVNKNIEPYSIVAGVPAKMIKKRFSDESIQELEDSEWWTWSVEKIESSEPFFAKNRI